MNKLLIIGHKNPDTDSIAASIVAADYFNNVLQLDAKTFRAGELNNETKFVLEILGIESPDLIISSAECEGIALVDHNEISQASETVDFNKVGYIIDHHKISVRTDKPIFCRIEPVGATSSLIAKMFFENNVDISETNAGLLLTGILSDTLNFTSPTTTAEDKEIAEKLNEIAKIDMHSFANEMFAAKSSLEGISVKNIISSDYKMFEMGRKKVGVGVWETTNPEAVNEKKLEILTAIKDKKQSEGLDYIFFMTVDIIKQASYMYLIGDEEKELAEKVFGGSTKDDILLLDKIVSRKKQIIPPLTEELNKLIDKRDINYAYKKITEG